MLVALALTTTALGTLMPILRDAGILDQRFGNFVVGAGAVGEFGPVVLVSMILAVDADEPLRAALLFVFAAIVVVATVLALRARPARVVRLVQTTMGTSGQLAVRLSLLLIDRARGARLRVRPRRDPRRVRRRDPGRDRDPRHARRTSSTASSTRSASAS